MISYRNNTKQISKKKVAIADKKVKMMIKFKAFNHLKLAINFVMILLAMKVKFFATERAVKKFEYIKMT